MQLAQMLQSASLQISCPCRGMMSTLFVQVKQGVTADDLRKLLAERFADDKFVVVFEKDIPPHTRHARGSNYCLMNVFEDRNSGRAIIISVILSRVHQAKPCRT